MTTLLRRWHRWISAILGIFLLVMAITGLGIQITDLVPGRDQRPAVAARAPARAAKPATWNHWLKKIHSGEEFGPAGVAVSIASGGALLFFAISGLWMYLAMFLRRTRSGSRDPFWR